MIDFYKQGNKKINLVKFIRHFQIGLAGLIALLLIVNPFFQIQFSSQFALATDNSCEVKFLDFEQYGKGDVVAGPVTGHIISASVVSNGNHDVLMVFDSDSAPFGEDTDLRTDSGRYGSGNNEPLGNVLIISEDSNSSQPDDEAKGGLMVFEFSQPVKVGDVGLLDIEESGGKITAYDENGNTVKEKSINALGDNSLQVIDMNASAVSKLTVKLKGSGALTSITYCQPKDVFNECQANEVPQAVIQPENLTVNLGDTADFSGMFSLDNNGEAISFTWSVPDLGITETGEDLSFTPDQAGEFTIILTAADECGSDEAEALLTVVDPGQCVGNATPEPAYSPQDPVIDLGASVNFTNLTTDQENDDLSFVWTVSEPGLQATSSDFSFTPPAEGEYTVKLIATDDCGQAEITTTVTVKSEASPPNECPADNIPPVAQAGNDKAVLIDESVLLDGTSSADADGDSLSYSWSISRLNLVINLATTSISFPSAEPEHNTVTLTVSDGCAEHTDVLDISVHNPGGPVPPPPSGPPSAPIPPSTSPPSGPPSAPIPPSTSPPSGPPSIIVTPPPSPEVKGTTTADVFVPPPASPRAGSPLPITHMALGLLSGLLTATGVYLFHFRKNNLEIMVR